MENAVIATLDEGKVVTRDVVSDERQGGTIDSTNEIIKNLGKKPTDWKVREYKPITLPQLGAAPHFVKVKTRQVCGVDIIDAWRARFMLGDDAGKLTDGQLIDLLQAVAQEHTWAHVEKLQRFDGEDGFTTAQGED